MTEPQPRWYVVAYSNSRYDGVVDAPTAAEAERLIRHDIDTGVLTPITTDVVRMHAHRIEFHEMADDAGSPDAGYDGDRKEDT